MTAGTGNRISFTYDDLKRQASTIVWKDNDHFLSNYYTYKTRVDENSQTCATGRVDVQNVYLGHVTPTGGNVIFGEQFYYDTLGNITSVYDGYSRSGNGTRLQKEAYHYDTQNQLTKEVMCFLNSAGTGILYNYTYDYTYDTAGNIQTITEKNSSTGATTTKTLSYDNSTWRDLLTAVDNSPILYEGQSLNGATVEGTPQSGNPIRYTNGTKTFTNLTWEKGRQLASLTTTNKGTYTYDYDQDGIRTGKIGYGTAHDYITQNGKVVRETISSPDLSVVMDFIYDNTGKPFALNYSTDNGATFTTYYYVLNLQGDVVMLVDEDGTIAANYRYNAWGEIISVTNAQGAPIPTSSHVAHLNPLRYRGYYYDTETGFYYLQSRYYDPALHRFINADDAEYSTMSAYSTNDTNLFTYCGNNPVNRVDDGGEFWNIIAGAVVGAVISTVTQVADNLIHGKDWHDGIALAAASGAITGGLAATGAPRCVQSLVSGVVAAGAECISQISSGQGIETGSIIAAGIGGFVSGALGGDGIRHKEGKLAKAQKIYDYAKEGLKTLKMSTSKASHYFDLAAKNFHKVIVKELNVTTAKYVLGGATGVVVKRALTPLFD